jgi:hypothetical protein
LEEEEEEKVVFFSFAQKRATKKSEKSVKIYPSSAANSMAWPFLHPETTPE